MLRLPSKDARLPETFLLLDLCPPSAVCYRFFRSRKTNRGQLFVLGFHYLVHRLLHIGWRIDFLQFRPDDLEAPIRCFVAKGLMKLPVYLSAFTVGGLEGHRSNEIAQ